MVRLPSIRSLPSPAAWSRWFRRGTRRAPANADAIQDMAADRLRPGVVGLPGQTPPEQTVPEFAIVEIDGLGGARRGKAVLRQPGCPVTWTAPTAKLSWQWRVDDGANADLRARRGTTRRSRSTCRSACRSTRCPLSSASCSRSAGPDHPTAGHGQRLLRLGQRAAGRHRARQRLLAPYPLRIPRAARELKRWKSEKRDVAADFRSCSPTRTRAKVTGHRGQHRRRFRQHNARSLGYVANIVLEPEAQAVVLQDPP